MCVCDIKLKDNRLDMFFGCSMYFCVFLCVVSLCRSLYFFVCICALYYCHRVATQLQLTNHISNQTLSVIIRIRDTTPNFLVLGGTGENSERDERLEVFRQFVLQTVSSCSLFRAIIELKCLTRKRARISCLSICHVSKNTQRISMTLIYENDQHDATV